MLFSSCFCCGAVPEAVEGPGADRRPCAGEKGEEAMKPTTMLAMFGEPTLEGTAREIEASIESIMKEAAK